MTDSTAWHWCEGCGRWEKPGKLRHVAMYWKLEDPDEGNFEGTADELARFKAWRELCELDKAAREDRITQYLKEKGNV